MISLQSFGRDVKLYEPSRAYTAQTATLQALHRQHSMHLVVSVQLSVRKRRRWPQTHGASHEDTTSPTRPRFRWAGAATGVEFSSVLRAFGMGPPAKYAATDACRRGSTSRRGSVPCIHVRTSVREIPDAAAIRSQRDEVQERRGKKLGAGKGRETQGGVRNFETLTGFAPRSPCQSSLFMKSNKSK